MKKMLRLFLTLAMLVCLCSCSAGNKETADKRDETNATAVPEVTPIPTPDVSAIVATNKNVEYVVKDDDTIEITHYKTYDEHLLIPETIDGYMVTSIGEKAFSLSPKLKTILLPNTLTSIGDLAFENSTVAYVNIPASVVHVGVNPFRSCENLEYVHVEQDHPVFEFVGGVLYNQKEKKAIAYLWRSGLPRDVALLPGTTSIGDYAFSGQPLNQIVFPDTLMEIGNKAFSGSSLYSVTIPDSVISIGDGAFRECRNLRSVTMETAIRTIGHYAFYESPLSGAMVLPEGLETIGQYAFSFTNLQSVVIPGSLKTIGDAFCNCASLTSVTINEGVEHMGDGAFSQCSVLTELVIPEGVLDIGDYAVQDCGALVITLPSSLTDIGFRSFRNNNTDRIYHVPRDSYAAQWCEKNNYHYTYSDEIN